MTLNNVLAAVVFLSSLPFCFADNMTKEQIQERIKPIGAVRVEPDASPKKVDDSLMVHVKPEEQMQLGKTIYTKHCILCHGSGLAGAPKFKDAQDWNVRLQDRSLNDLLATALKGLNAMPAKGTCNECSEEDLKAAITYMLPKS